MSDEDGLPVDVLEVLGGKSLEEVAISVDYKNWRGEVRERKIVPLDCKYGSTQYHEGNQWLLRVYDVEKSAYRVYALSDIQSWNNIPRG